MMNLVEMPHDFPHQPPKGYSYEATDFKKNVVAIWLRHHRKYIYASNDVRTIWGFVKTKRGRKGSITKTYHAPINSNKVGNEVDIKSTRNYTAMQLNLNPLESAIYNV
tara:strand:+ start:30 stop:353 length:324 start_codon:yes stop_codon:yes gene_type:complete